MSANLKGHHLKADYARMQYRGDVISFELNKRESTISRVKWFSGEQADQIKHTLFAKLLDNVFLVQIYLG